MVLKWIVRAKRAGVPATDTLGNDVVLVVGQRGWLPHADALASARKGDVDILSPDGVAALANEPHAPEPRAPEHRHPELETPDGVQAEAEIAVPPEATKAAAPRGFQMKRPQPQPQPQPRAE